MRFDFDDGRLPTGDSTKGISDIDDDMHDLDNVSDDDESMDSGLVKSMPRTEERAQRALEKRKMAEKKHTTKKKNGSESDENDDSDLDETGRKEEKEYFDSIVESNKVAQIEMFSQFNLSRAILRAIEESRYVSPTRFRRKLSR